VSPFRADWLRLREPYDHAARSAALTTRFAAAVGSAPRLIDLGCGTGSNLRYLAPRLPVGQQWLCVDHDQALLSQARMRLVPSGRSVRFRALDLACALPDPAGWTAITASALLDLASAAWLDRLARWCKDRPILMALSVDGRLSWRPKAPEDETIRQRFAANQASDKGFGTALGPDAARYLARCLEALDQHVVLERADWELGPADAPLLSVTLEGFIGAVQELRHDRVSESWAEVRRRQLAAGRLQLTVGHVDLLALPA
jgi:SAM-dependent methyltransferase